LEVRFLTQPYLAPGGAISRGLPEASGVDRIITDRPAILLLAMTKLALVHPVEQSQPQEFDDRPRPREQPAGMCLHVSVPDPWPRVAPNMVVCAMIFNALDLPDEAEDVWG
jgi:hypothetical protein